MPYAIRQTADCDYEVYDESTAAPVARAGSEAKAEALIRALDAADAGGEGEGKSAAGGLEFKSVPFEVKAVGEDGSYQNGYMEGYAAVFNNLDSGGDIIVPGAFKAGIDRFLRDGFIGNLNHGWDSPIGHPVEARETPEGLYIKAVFDASPDAQSVRAKMTPHPETGRATIRKFSIGYRPVEAGNATADEVKSYWKSVGYKASDAELANLASRKKARMLRKTDLFEASPVSVAMNERALVASVKCGCGMGGHDAPMPGYGPARPGGPTLDDATGRIRDSVVGIFLDYLMMSVRVVVANEMVAPEDRLAILGQTFDQTRDAFLQYLKPILAADADEDDAAEAIGETLESLGKQFHANLEAAGVDVDTKALASLESGGLDDFLPAVESAVGHFLATHRDRLGIRLKEGRTLSASNVDRLRKVRHSLHGHVGAIDDMLRQAGHEPGEPTEPAADEADGDGGAGAGRKPKAAAAPVRPAFPPVPAAAGTQPLILGGKSAGADDLAVEAKGVVPYASGPVLAAAAWDGPAAEGRVRRWASSDGSGDKDTIDWGKYAKAFAYVDAGPATDFGDYHLLHHDVADGELKVARRGVFAAAVIMQGGRSGADFVKLVGPQAAAGIKAHLGKHYSDDLEMPAPWDRGGDGGPGPEGKAAPAEPDLSAYFVQFHATDPALLGIDGAQ